MNDFDLILWKTQLDAAARMSSGFVKHITVVAETDSTQDEARRLNALPGHLIVTGRQTAGRGRRSRIWADTGHDGIALTLVVKAEDPPATALASAVATAIAIERAGGVLRTGIKWPNDIILQRRKVAGILVEVRDELVVVGIGINVRQARWPGELADKAISLTQAGIDVDRLSLMIALIHAMTEAAAMSDADRAAAFALRDVLTGSEVTLLHRQETIEGRILSIDPLRSISMATEAGNRTISTQGTTILHTEGLDRPTPSTR